MNTPHELFGGGGLAALCGLDTDRHLPRINRPRRRAALELGDRRTIVRALLATRLVGEPAPCRSKLSAPAPAPARRPRGATRAPRSQDRGRSPKRPRTDPPLSGLACSTGWAGPIVPQDRQTCVENHVPQTRRKIRVLFLSHYLPGCREGDKQKVAGIPSAAHVLYHRVCPPRPRAQGCGDWRLRTASPCRGGGRPSGDWRPPCSTLGTCRVSRERNGFRMTKGAGRGSNGGGGM